MSMEWNVNSYAYGEVWVTHDCPGNGWRCMVSTIDKRCGRCHKEVPKEILFYIDMVYKLETTK